MTHNRDPKHDAFLQELSELSLKHGVYVDGCGCCGSPRLETAEGDGHYLLSHEDPVEGNFCEVKWVKS